MIKVGITGQAGFVGTHLYNYLGLQENIERIAFKDAYFQDQESLNTFVSNCDAVVHLAAMNRHNDPEVIYQTNISLVQKLIEACERTQSKPHILFSSSIQESRENPYGRSKKEGRLLLEKWASEHKAGFTGLIIPNVYGPFGHPYYNSVVATFCHQLTHNETPQIQVDGDLKLIYVHELVSEITRQIAERKGNQIQELHLKHTAEIKVSELLSKLTSFRDNYFSKGEIPDIAEDFNRNLFNTFLCYIDHKDFYPFHYKLHTDDRGSFVETMKLKNGGQVSFSTTKPGITRGNHFHTRKAERFAVIKGKARIAFRRIGTDEVFFFDLDGKQPSFVDMPVWFTHKITNTGDEDLYTLFWINEYFNPEDADTFFEEV